MPHSLNRFQALASTTSRSNEQMCNGLEEIIYKADSETLETLPVDREILLSLCRRLRHNRLVINDLLYALEDVSRYNEQSPLQE